MSTLIIWGYVDQKGGNPTHPPREIVPCTLLYNYKKLSDTYFAHPSIFFLPVICLPTQYSSVNLYLIFGLKFGIVREFQVAPAAENPLTFPHEPPLVVVEQFARHILVVGRRHGLHVVEGAVFHHVGELLIGQLFTQEHTDPPHGRRQVLNKGFYFF